MSHFRVVFLTGMISLCSMPMMHAEPALEIALSPQQISLSETAQLKIEVTWPKQEANYTFAFPSLDLTNLEVERQGESQETYVQAGQELVRKTFLIELKPVKAGPGQIAPFKLSYVDPAVQKGGEFSIAAQKLTVMKPLFAPHLRIWVVLAAILILATVAAGYLFFKVKKTNHTAEESAPLSLETKMVRELSALANNPSSGTSNDIRLLGTIFQRYLLEKFELSQNQSWSKYELLQSLKSKGISRDDVEAVEKLMGRLEEAKFMGASLTPSDIRSLENDMRIFIDKKRILGQP